jgi:hypothetical protein
MNIEHVNNLIKISRAGTRRDLQSGYDEPCQEEFLLSVGEAQILHSWLSRHLADIISAMNRQQREKDQKRRIELEAELAQINARLKP